MNKRDLAKFKKLLLKEYEQLTGSIKNIEEITRNESSRDGSGDISEYAETGTDNNEIQTALSIASGESTVLQDVVDALRRIEDGTYGICEGTGEKIPRARLEAIPHARYCVKYQEELEKERRY